MKTWNRWVDIWTGTEESTPLACFRMALGAIVFVDQAMHLWSGAVNPLYVPVDAGGFAPVRHHHVIFELIDHSVALTWTLWFASMLTSGAVMLGLGGRAMAFLLLQSMLLWHALPLDIGGGYDRLLTGGLFLLVVGPATTTLSVDCRLRTGRWTSADPVPVLARYLGILQLCVMYTATGFAKRGAGWTTPYESVYLSLQRESWSRVGGEVPWLAEIFPLLQLSTRIAWWWEATFFVLGLWFMASFGWFGARAQTLAHRVDLRWPYLLIGLVMHVTLTIFLNVGTFPTVTLAYYVLLLRKGGPKTTMADRPAVLHGAT